MLLGVNALKASIVLSVMFFSACPPVPGTDGGTGGRAGGSATGGGATGGGATGGGATGGGATGGGATGGGATGGGATGGGSGVDAGLPSCTFGAPFELGPSANPTGGLITSAVAVTDEGEAIYLWNDGRAIRWRVQSPSGVLGPEVVDPDAGTVPVVVVSARGERALIAYSTLQGNVYETRTRRYSGVGGWEPVQKVLPDSATAGALTLALDSDGTASMWRQDAYGTGPIVEYTSMGVGPIGTPHQLTTSGFMYNATRASGRRLAITLATLTDTPEFIFTDSTGDTRAPLTGAAYANDNYPSAIADDGSATIGGQFRVNGAVGMGVVTRTGGLTSPAELVTPVMDGGMFGGYRTLGALAGPGGMGLVVWWDQRATTVFESHRSAGGSWSAPRPVATTTLVVPRFSLLSASRGLVHVETTMGPQRIELNVDGFLGPPAPSSDFAGVVYGVVYAASHSTAAAIKTARGADGGWVVSAAQCK